MDSRDFDSDESEIIADDLSDYSCSKRELSDSDSYFSEDSDIFPMRKRSRTYYLPNSDSESGENDSDIEDELSWTETDEIPNLETFLGEASVKVLPSDPTNILDVVKLFIADDLFSFFTEESNKYRSQNADKFRDSKKSVKWKDISVLEMKKFIGLILMMGKVQKDTRDEYWTTDPGCATPIFSQIMSRDRFRQIWKSWHFCDNLTLINANNGRLAKIQPVLDYFIPKFLNVYKPRQQLSLDESIIPWRGRLSFRVYNAGKIIKYGILVRMVCESTSGYICNFKIYAAEKNPLLHTIQSVLEPYYNLWHHVYMDNFYNSVKNTEILLRHGIRICGTIRINRGFPTCLKRVKLQRGHSIYRRKNQILLQIWKTKKKDIRMITNIHSAAFRETNKIDYKTGEMVKKPSCIDDYNKFMKGVDRADQYISYYKIMRKTVKWTKRVVMFLINCALFNSYRIYNLLNTKQIKYKQFIYTVGCKWAIESTQEHQEAMPSTSRATSRKDNNLRLSGDLSKHKLKKITCTTKVKYPTRKCRVCTVHKKRGETRYICSFCTVALHKGDCFERYHSLIDY